MSNDHKDIDHISGVETTGHEWDGLKELNNPAPRWWLWVFYITIIWSLVYFVLYPSWPTLSGATQGILNTNQYKDLAESTAEITARQNVWLEKFSEASYDQIMADENLSAFALAGGAAAFKNNCATCHGTGAAGMAGYPNLNDDDWLWGGTFTDIEQTLMYGIRSGHEQARMSQMPAFGRDKLLSAADINTVTDYVVAMAGGTATSDMAGAQIFQTNCASCHGSKGEGGRNFGAPRLTDAIWLYGGAPEDIHHQIQNPRHGVMPSWGDRLPAQTIRQLTVYIHSLGGGEKDTPMMPEGGDDAQIVPAP